MQAVYRMESNYIIDSEENYGPVFGSKIHIAAQYDKGKDIYTFIINQTEALLDGKPAEKLMDRIMHEAGCSYYPLFLSVSPRLWILDVPNFKEVKLLRQECAGNLRKKMPSPELERYFRFSEKNMENSKTFIASLYRNSFYKLYFRDIFTPAAKDEVRLIHWPNFPSRDTDRSCWYRVNPVEANKIRLSGQIMKIAPEHNGTFEAVYETGPDGEIRRINGKIETRVENKSYIKRLSLDAETSGTRKDTGSLIVEE